VPYSRGLLLSLIEFHTFTFTATPQISHRGRELSFTCDDHRNFITNSKTSARQSPCLASIFSLSPQYVSLLALLILCMCHIILHLQFWTNKPLVMNAPTPGITTLKKSAASTWVDGLSSNHGSHLRSSSNGQMVEESLTNIPSQPH
jgi:hypothetical protein